ncbi:MULTISPECIES: hypothetical protein [Pseudomonas]|uniref:Uncharacterized protein n=1 Tax=Pseudomonas lutea TaxID=243924 RepID=A0A9X8MH28_9PSED|nr:MULTISPECIES: hypothetical protein [Pseudomonas]SER36128.1 hypothetical protein SAMN05216409_11839 [Pseudomonas lutea]
MTASAPATVSHHNNAVAQKLRALADLLEAPAHPGVSTAVIAVGYGNEMVPFVVGENEWPRTAGMLLAASRDVCDPKARVTL